MFKCICLNLKILNKNIFFDIRKLKHYGKNSIIGKTVRIRHPELCSIADNSIIDDFAYVSTGFIVGSYVHISTHLTVGGGSDYTFRVGNFSGISAGVKIWCSSDDFINDVITLIPKKFKDKSITGDIIMEDFTGIGANSIIMPNVTISEGATVGALSLVKSNSVLKPWTYYAGIPARPIRKRNKEHIMKEFLSFKKSLKNN